MRKLLLQALLILAAAQLGSANSVDGYNVIGSSSNAFGANQVLTSQPVQATTTSTWGSIPIYVVSAGSGTGHMNVAVYDQSSLAPTTAICNATQQTITASNTWYTYSLASAGCPAPTPYHFYFLGFNKDDSSISIADNGGSGGPLTYFKSMTYNTWGSMSGASSLGYVASLYVNFINGLQPCGNTSPQTGGLASGANLVLVSPCTPGASGPVNDVEIYVETAFGNCDVAVFSGYGSSSQSLVCQATSAACAAWQWNKFDMTSAGCGTLSAGGSYGAAYNLSNGSTVIGEVLGSSGSNYNQAQTFGSFASLTTASAGGASLAAYINLSAPAPAPQGLPITVGGLRDASRPGLGLEPTPAMGMIFGNAAYDDLTHEPTQLQVEAQADAMVSTGMVSAGYNFLRSAYVWASSISSCTLQLNTSPLYTDMTALTNYLHADGVRHQIYLSTGSPSCGAAPSSVGCESTVAAQVASYGADSIENDLCNPSWPDRQTAQANYSALGTALHNTGRPMQYLVSISNLPANAEGQAYWCPSVYGTEWWSDNDTGSNPTWTAYVSNIFDTIDPGGAFTSTGAPTPGCWAMPLYVVVGTTSLLTSTEQQSVMSLFSMVPAPLWLYLNLATQCATSPCTSSSPEVLLVTNRNVIGTDQDPLAVPAALASSVTCGSSGCNVFLRPTQGGSYSMVAWNRDTASHSVAMSLPSGTWNGWDLWANSSIGSVSGTYTPSVAAHGVAHIALCPGATTWHTGATPYPKCQ